MMPGTKTRGTPSGACPAASSENVTSRQGQTLPLHQRMSYGTGHVLNDLTAAVWFSYMLIFLQHVANFSSAMAGNVILLGQVADALVTPIIGLKSDKSGGKCASRLGRRKSWHLLGTICVGVSFPFLMMTCLTCTDTTSRWLQFLYYAAFVVLFQFGWATGQVAHLALINDLARRETDRIELSSIRYGWTVACNVSVYVIAWILFGYQGTESQTVSSADAGLFKNLGLIVVGVGLSISIVFHVFTRENNYAEMFEPGKSKESAIGFDDVTTTVASDDGVTAKTRQNLMVWRDWLTKMDFYLVALLYMCARLSVNISQVYLPLFVTYSLGLRKDSIATIPLVVYISGFLVTLFSKMMSQFATMKTMYVWGAVNLLAACTWMWFLERKCALPVYGTTIFLGVGGTTVMVSSLSITADMIGSRTESGAFVYGSMSFADKLSSGGVVALIQFFHPCKSASCCAGCVWYYRVVITLVPTVATALSLIVLVFMHFRDSRRKKYSADAMKNGKFLPQNEPLL